MSIPSSRLPLTFQVFLHYAPQVFDLNEPFLSQIQTKFYKKNLLTIGMLNNESKPVQVHKEIVDLANNPILNYKIFDKPKELLKKGKKLNK